MTRLPLLARSLLRASVPVLFLTSGACKDGSGPSRTPTTLSLSQAAATIDDGGTLQLSATIRDQNDQPFDTPPTGFTLQWSSSGPTTASVDPAGLVTANRPGQAWIRASAGTLRDSANLTVRAVATALQYASGNEQSGPPGSALPQQVVVRVVDRHGSDVSGVTVEFSVTSGSGTVSPSSVASDAGGLARATWTLGTAGANALEARSGTLAGSPVAFTATGMLPTGLVLGSISPDPLVEGQNATLTGTGFSTVAANNRVTVGGVTASVLSASATSLQIRVPSICQPPGPVEVRVAIGTEQSNPLNHPLRPAASLSVAVGQQLILSNPSDFCLHFAPSAGDEAYLIGVQSVSEAPSSLTPVTFQSAVAGGTAGQLAASAALPLAPEGQADGARGGARIVPPLDAREVERLQDRYAAEQQLRDWERRNLAPRARESLVHRRRGPADALPLAISPNVQVGDTVQIRVPGFATANSCLNFTGIATVVRAIGTRGVWVEDVANPANGFTTADFQSLSQFFDAEVYPVLADYFGAPTDVDANQRVVIVATKEVNKLSGVGGFAFAGDLFPRGTCASSDEGEYYYAFVPDPTGIHGTARTKDDVVRSTRLLIPHEVGHVIQLGRRMQFGGPWQSSWELEGQATLAEEIMGHKLANRSPLQNYGFSVAFNSPATLDIWWYRAFSYLAQYYGFQNNTARVANAPEQCTLLGGTRQGNNGPCTNPDFNYYGASWSFLRWLSDHFGPGFSGGEKGLHKALIENGSSGFGTISSVVNTPIDSLLAQWAAALYVDDRVAGANPRLTLPSWNLLAIEQGLVQTARLEPRQRTFSAFTDQITVRGASTGYFRVSGSGRPATAIRIRGSADALLPGTMRVWVVRLQ